MKKYLFIISLLLSNILLVAQIDHTRGVWDFCEDDQLTSFPSTGVHDSRNGFSHSPRGQIRFLMAFVELEYGDTTCDPSLHGTPEWPVGQLPLWKDELLEYNVPNGLSNCAITKYYQLASSNDLIVLGDYLVAPDNGGVFKMSSDSGVVKKDSIINTINRKLGDSFTTAHGFSSISYFDVWTTTNEGETKINTGNNNWDFVVFIIRNSTYPDNLTGHCGTFSSLSLMGHPADGYAAVCTNGSVPTHIIRHIHKSLWNIPSPMRPPKQPSA